MTRRWLAAWAVVAAAAVAAAPVGAWAQSSSTTPPTPLTLNGTVAVAGGGAVPDGVAIHTFINGQETDNGPTVTTSGGAFTSLAVDPSDPSLVGDAVSFTVGALAATAVFTGQAPAGAPAGACTAAANQPVTFLSGDICLIALSVFSVPSTTPLQGSVAATSTTPGGSVTVGGSGSSVPDTTVTASGGTGTVAVAQYGSAPAGAPALTLSTQTNNAYLDVNVTPGSTFTTVTVLQCGMASGAKLYWLNGGTWTLVSPQQESSGGCITATLGGSSSPRVGQLQGTVFAATGTAAGSGPTPAPTTSGSAPAPAAGGGGGGSIPPYVTGLSPASGPAGTQVTLTGTNFTGAVIVFFNGVPGSDLVVDSDTQLTVDAPSGLTGTVYLTVQNAHGTSAAVPAAVFTYSAGTVAASASVTTAGGTLATPDGLFTMTVPAGDLTGSGSLTLAESAAAPTGLPAGFVAASPTFTLTGASLTTPVDAVIQYQASVLKGRQPQRLAVYAQSASGGWSFVPTQVGASGSVSVKVSGPETLVVLANTMTFSDIPAGYWARGDIDTLLAAGVVAGFPNGTFQPGGALTRAEFVKMLDVALGIAPGTGTGGFTDVAAGDWFAPYVSAAVHAGLVQGLTATTFGPSDTVSREQMAVLLARALKLTGGANLTFSDAGQIDAYAQAAVAAAVAAGYLSGFPDGTFQPLAATTRAQAAKVLAMALAAEAAAH